MRFLEKNTIRDSEGPNGFRESPVETYLMGEYPILEWKEEDYSSTDYYQIFPVWKGGERGWMERNIFQGRNGNTAEYCQDSFLGFVDGIKLLLGRGAFQHIFGDTFGEKKR